MSPKFSFKSGLLSVTLSAAAAFAVLAPAPEAQAGNRDEPVKCDDLKSTNLKSSCTKNGGKRSAIKDIMLAAQKEFKKNDKYSKVKCKDCHEDGNNGGALIGNWEAMWKDGFEKLVEAKAK